MRVKLPENFGSISHAGNPVDLTPDADGCVDVEDGVAQALLTHGGTIAPDVAEENERVEGELKAHDQRAVEITSKKQKGRQSVRVADDEDAKDEG
jgi:hypothetical protein